MEGKSSNRWFTYSLRELALGVAIVGVALGWSLDHKRYAAGAKVVDLARSVDRSKEGDERMACIAFDGETYVVTARREPLINFSMGCCR